MVVITMTSWTKRIKNVAYVIKSILDNTVKVDLIFINLSVEEFPNKENDLPHNLLNLLKKYEKIFLNWVEGENTKTMKKIFPILKYLEDDDIIIDCDDDMFLPKDLIQSRLTDFYKCRKMFSITGTNKFKLFNCMYKCSPLTVFTKKMLNNWEKITTPEVIKTYNDDDLYTCILWLNGYLTKPCSKYRAFTKEIPSFNPVCGSYDMKLFKVCEEFNNVVFPVIEKITGKHIKKSFGYFKKNKL